MKNTILLIGLAFLISLTSCVPYKDLVYLQNQEKALDSITNVVEIQKPYRVQINDILSIRVKALDQESVQIFNPVGNENLNATNEENAYFDGFTVDLHGNIRMPVLGEINVLGYTTVEIRELLEKLLLEKEFKSTANIFVTVKLAGLRYTATGEVNSPGTQLLYREKVNVFEALANSGEISEAGNRKEVLIIRQYPQGQKIHKIDLTDLNVMQSPYYYIQHNDMIYVKPVKQKAWGTGLTGRDALTTIISLMGLVTTSILLIRL
ncbi:MAG: sugar transporter [Winogradskyella sp.]|uniref:polysaccharide biosynthesis/export family protein n=1 Tax=Winogradskyella sp. TaxID=1883156 RepID=UPI0017CFDB3B|nr:sugar transporter [Winogradskyella sp.]